jgi:tetratricopeptide (TPR) repeat protein
VFRIILVLAAILAVAASPASAQTVEPTFNRDIAPLLWRECGSCHRDGGIAPFPLLRFSDVRPRTQQVLTAIRSGAMPPWLPEPGYGHFIGERRLTPDEKALIEAWVRGGSREGAASDRREPPVWTDGWQLGTPDLVVELPEPFLLQPGKTDVFRNFVLPVPVDTTRYVRGIEVDPGHRGLVHHASIALDASRGSRALDALDPQPGFEGSMFSETARTAESRALGWTPGITPSFEPPDMAWRLDAGSDIVLLVHMIPPTRAKPVAVRPRVGLFFADGPPSRAPLDFKLGSKSIDIPAGEADYAISDAYELPADVDLLSIYPHAHYLAREIKAWAELPGGEKQWLLWIRNWDFHWQDQYRYEQPVALSKGTTLRMEYVYDNSTRNRNRTAAHAGRVAFGGQSTDEMGDLWLRLVPKDAAGAELLARGHRELEARRDIDFARLRITQEPARAHWRNMLGVGLLAAGDVAGAAAAFADAIRIEPGNGEAHHNLGAARQLQGAAAEAIAHFRRAAELSPDNYQVQLSLGTALDEAGESVAAIDAYRRAIALNPLSADAHNNLGVALASQGAVKEALGHFQRAVEIRPDYQDAQDNVKTALEVLGTLRN